MNESKRVRCVSVLLAAAVAMLVFATTSMGRGVQTPPDSATRTGELRIEGEHITQLDLIDRGGRTEHFESPGSTVTLPEGEYRLYMIILQDQNEQLVCGSHKTKWVVVEPNRTAVLKVGAPLRQVVKVERCGAVMMLNHAFIGQGSETYRIERRAESQPPKFVLYKGDTKLLSGDFKFG